MNDIFVSYSINDSHVQVQHIKAVLKERGYRLIIDTESIKPYLSIKEFMDKIPSGSAILIFVSKTYFKSDYCLYELSQIWSTSEQSRIFPIYSGEFNLSKIEIRLKLGEELENRIRKLKKKVNAGIKNNRPLKESTQILECFENLRLKYDEILFYLSDTASVILGEDLTHSIYRAVDLIEERLEKDRQLILSNMEKISLEVSRLKTSHEAGLSRERLVNLNYYDNTIYIPSAGKKYPHPIAELENTGDTLQDISDILIEISSDIRVLNKAKHLELLIGPAGSGKSSILIEMCKHFLNGHYYTFYLDLRHYSEYETSKFEEYIYLEIMRETKLEESTRLRSFADLMEVFANLDAQLLILLDEFDQLERSVQVKIMENIIFFIDRWKIVKSFSGIVLATRPGSIVQLTGYTNEKFIKQINNVYYLSSWDSSMRQTYLDNWESSTGAQLAKPEKNVLLIRPVYNSPLMFHLALCLAGNNYSDYSTMFSPTSLIRNYIGYMVKQTGRWDSRQQALLQAVAWCNAIEYHKTYERFLDGVESEWSAVYNYRSDTWQFELLVENVGETGLFRIDRARVVFIHNEIQDYLAAVHLFEVSKNNASVNGGLMLPARYLKVLSSWHNEKYRSICRMYFKICERLEYVNTFLYEQIFNKQISKRKGLDVPSGVRSAAKFVVSILAEGAEYTFWKEIINISLVERTLESNSCLGLFGGTDDLAEFVSDILLLMSNRMDVYEMVVSMKGQGDINESILGLLPDDTT